MLLRLKYSNYVVVVVVVVVVVYLILEPGGISPL